MLVDSHCHLTMLDLEPFQGDLRPVLKLANNHQVNYLLCVCTDLSNAQQVVAVAKQFPNIAASFGVHPCEALTDVLAAKEIVKYASAPEVVAIGETGLDYYHAAGDGATQREQFRQHIRAARELNKPLIIHTRQAQEDTLKILQAEKAGEVGGVMHCFTESTEMALQAMELGFYISFSGIITFKNAVALRQVVADVGIERILVETDSPYLAPMPYRGKSNLPHYVHFVAEEVAKIKQLPFETVAEQTTQNFFNLFKQAKYDKTRSF